MGIKRVGFDLEAVPAPASEPFWGKATRVGTQAVMDQQYLFALTNWYERVDGWLEANRRKAA